MSNIAISVKHLTKIYKLYDKPIDRLKESLHPLKKQYHKDFYALNDVSFEIKRGETVGIIGKNGAGKSTLLKIITGVLTPTSGSVHVHGRISSLLELGAGFNTEYTGIENIYFQGSLMGYTREEMESKIDDILAFADIGDFVHQSVKMYSSGMFARLAFAMAINVDPDVLIVDEALSVGDIHFVQKCMIRIGELKGDGTTILFVSHDATAIRMLCDSAIWISDGKILDIGKTPKVVDNYLAFMSNDKQIIQHVDTVSRVENICTSNDSESTALNTETRMGTLECEILECEILDSDYKKCFAVYNDSSFILRFSFINHTFEEGKDLIIGYSLRNSFGVDIASSNNKIEGISILSPKQNNTQIIDINILLPQLYPDQYTLNLSLASTNHDGSINTLDVIYGAITLDILSIKQINVLLSFRTSFKQHKIN